jgi:hypothetical protein
MQMSPTNTLKPFPRYFRHLALSLKDRGKSGVTAVACCFFFIPWTVGGSGSLRNEISMADNSLQKTAKAAVRRFGGSCECV